MEGHTCAAQLAVDSTCRRNLVTLRYLTPYLPL